MGNSDTIPMIVVGHQIIHKRSSQEKEKILMTFAKIVEN